GLIDEIVEGDLVAGAVRFARAKLPAGVRKTRDLVIGVDAKNTGLAACARMLASLKAEPQAPRAATLAVQSGLTLDFDAGSVRERELFAYCVVSVESRALRHLFFAEREAAKVPDIPKDTPTVAIRRAAVVGAGTMGGGIAMTYANAGIPVLLKEADDLALQRGLSVIRKNYEASMSRGKISQTELEKA